MITLLSAAVLAAQLPEQRCRSALARKAGGEISEFQIDSRRHSGRSTILGGSLTVLLGRQTPAAGYAGTHHLIRADYRFSCSVRGKKAVRSRLTQP